MKNFIRKIFFVVFFISLPVLAFHNIAVLNLDAVFKESLEYKKNVNFLNYKIKNSFEEKKNEINKLIEKEKKIESQSDLFDVNQFKKMKEDLFLKKNNIIDNIHKLEAKYNTENIEIYNKIYLKIKKIVLDIIKVKHYDLILDSNATIFYNKKIVDITYNVIKKINLNVKK